MPQALPHDSTSNADLLRLALTPQYCNATFAIDRKEKVGDLAGRAGRIPLPLVEAVCTLARFDLEHYPVA